MNTKNLKPFNLQAALQGEPVMLRDGNKAFVRHHETEHQLGAYCEVWGVMNRTDDGSNKFMLWSAAGRYEMMAHSSLDIIGMWTKTRVINGFEVPAPETQELELGQRYYVVCLNRLKFFFEDTWDGDKHEIIALKRNLVFLSEEDVVANAKAMLGINPHEEAESER